MNWGTNFFHRTACSEGSITLHCACSNDGNIYFARQKKGGTGLRVATFEEFQKHGGTMISFAAPPGAQTIVGPHLGSEVVILSSRHADGRARITIIGSKVQYESYDGGFYWYLQGEGNKPLGFIGG